MTVVSDSCPAVRLQALGSIALVGARANAAVTRAVLTRLADPLAPVRCAVVRALGQVGGPGDAEAIGALARIIDADAANQPYLVPAASPRPGHLRAGSAGCHGRVSGAGCAEHLACAQSSPEALLAADSLVAICRSVPGGAGTEQNAREGDKGRRGRSRKRG